MHQTEPNPEALSLELAVCKTWKNASGVSIAQWKCKLASSHRAGFQAPQMRCLEDPRIWFWYRLKGKVALEMMTELDSDGKESACNEGDLLSIPESEDPLEEEMATHSSILVWRIP